MSLVFFVIIIVMVLSTLFVQDAMESEMLPFPKSKTKLSFILQGVVILYYALGGLLIWVGFQLVKEIIRNINEIFCKWKELPWRDKK